MLVFAIVTLFGVVQSRAVNISNTWMLPEEGFPVFYRYFRDRISWYEADAVCQFHHANLVTADSSSQYDAIRAYLKELDITEKVWIGLSKPQDKPSYLWTDFRPLSGGHWQEALPASDTQSLCAVMDPAADFLWKALPCGGPEVAAFICEMPIPSWALGSRGCLLTELPSLTVLYIPEQSALELTSDCGLDGTKRIACKGNADHEEMLKQLTCVMAHEDIDDDKTAKTSMTDYYESSTWADTSDDDGKVTKNWNSNTINPDHLTPTRHRRETEDTLSPLSTKSSFKENSGTNYSWQEQHQEKAVLTTQHVLLDSHVTPTPATNLNLDELSSKTPTSAKNFGNTKLMHTAEKIMSIKEDKDLADNVKSTQTLPTEKFPATQRAVAFASSSPKPTEDLKTDSVSASPRSIATEGTSTTTTQEGNVEDYPSAISQGQLFSIIENGTMFDIIELNETAQASLTSINKITLSDSTTEHVQTTTDRPTNANVSPKLPVPTKKSTTKKPVQPTKKVYKKDIVVKHLPAASTTKRIQSVDEMEEKLTKEFEMMPDVKDTSVRLNRTFRKELPVVIDEDTEHTNLENGSQYGVPRILNFTVVNAVDFDNDEGFQRDQPQQDDKNITETVVISNNDGTEVEDKVTTTVVKEPIVDTAATNSTENNSNYRVVETTVTDIENKVVVKKPLVTESLPEDKIEISKRMMSVTTVPEHNPIDPRLYMANHHTVVHPSNHSESVATHNAHVTTEKSKLTKEDFLPKSLIGDKPLASETPTPDATAPYSQTSDGYSEHPFPSDEPKKINRHRSLHNNKGRKFYPYFFSRMLG